MSDPDFKKIITEYDEAFRLNGRSASAVMCPKGRQQFRYQKMIEGINLVGKSILDFGCGLAHLFEYLVESNAGVTDYYGVDICESFLSDNRARFSNKNAHFINLDDFDTSVEAADVALVVGTFNLKYHLDYDNNWKYITSEILRIWSKTNQVLILNWMTDRVDFVQADAFHVSPEAIIKWGTNNLSKRFRVDASYMPYEFHICFFKNTDIKRPDNVYEELVD